MNYQLFILPLLALLAMLISGCAITASGIYPGLAPGDEVQTIDVTVVGISLDATRDSLDIGYKKLRMTRVPSFEKPAVLPSVTAETSTTTQGPSVGITDKLEVNTYED